MCLGYVKVALHQSGYINGVPGTALAKDSGHDWISYGFRAVGATLTPEPITITYEKAYDLDISAEQNKKIAEKEAKIKALKNDLADLQKKLTKLQAAKKKTAAKEAAAQKVEIDAAQKAVNDKKDAIATKEKEEPLRTVGHHTQPDLIYTLPGDVILYEQVEPFDPGAAGHIDIRTYHNFCADFARPQPLPALGVSGKTRFKVKEVYRKNSDTLAMARVEAFLRIIREQVAGETSLKEKDRSYHVLSYNKEDKENPFVKFDDLSAHPFAEIKRDKPAGAYQINLTMWIRVTGETGWPKKFTPEMQDRIAMYLLQSYPNNYPDHRRSALGYIMENEIDKAVDVIKQEMKLVHWHEIINEKFDIKALKKKFEMYSKGV